MARTCYLKEDRCKNPTRRYTPATAVGAGTLVKINISATQCIAGVTIADIAANATGMIDDKSVYAIPAASNLTFAEGAIVSWDSDNNTAIAYASMSGVDDFVAGSAYKAKVAGETFVWVVLNHGATAFTRQNS